MPLQVVRRAEGLQVREEARGEATLGVEGDGPLADALEGRGGGVERLEQEVGDDGRGDGLGRALLRRCRRRSQ